MKALARKPGTFLFVILLLTCSTILVVPRSYADTWDPFHTKAEHIQRFQDLAGDTATVIGQTEQNQDIWMFEYGNPNGGVVMWDGQLHGNEDYGTEIIYMIADWLINSGTDRAERIQEGNRILFIPVINVDGHRRASGTFEGRCNINGVNLNRNFETGFRVQGEGTDGYSGSFAASESETQTMIQAFKDYQPEFYVNLHQGAGPKFGRYSGASSSIGSQVTSIANDIADHELAYLYNTQWSGSLMSGGTFGSNGFAIGDAHKYAAATSYLVEIDPSWRHDTADMERIENIYFPQCLAMFIAMCEICESDISPSHTTVIQSRGTIA